jgi:hypothetical protein
VALLSSVAMVRYLSHLLVASGLSFVSDVLSAALPTRDGTTPVVTVKNGSYSGIYSSQYDQDFFLGMPYAQVSVL